MKLLIEKVNYYPKMQRRKNVVIFYSHDGLKAEEIELIFPPKELKKYIKLYLDN